MYRVIQWGTGNVGTHALRTIVGRPDLELVGVKVYDEAKRGLDAGELIGQEPLGVTCVVDLDEVLAIDADCALEHLIYGLPHGARPTGAVSTPSCY